MSAVVVHPSDCPVWDNHPGRVPVVFERWLNGTYQTGTSGRGKLSDGNSFPLASSLRLLKSGPAPDECGDVAIMEIILDPGRGVTARAGSQEATLRAAIAAFMSLLLKNLGTASLPIMTKHQKLLQEKYGKSFACPTSGHLFSLQKLSCLGDTIATSFRWAFCALLEVRQLVVLSPHVMAMPLGQRAADT